MFWSCSCTECWWMQPKLCGFYVFYVFQPGESQAWIRSGVVSKMYCHLSHVCRFVSHGSMAGSINDLNGGESLMRRSTTFRLRTIAISIEGDEKHIRDRLRVMGCILIRNLVKIPLPVPLEPCHKGHHLTLSKKNIAPWNILLHERPSLSALGCLF